MGQYAILSGDSYSSGKIGFTSACNEDFTSKTIHLETFYNNSIPCNYLITSKFLGSLANLAKNIADDFLLIPASSLIIVINFGIIYLKPMLESIIT